MTSQLVRSYRFGLVFDRIDSELPGGAALDDVDNIALAATEDALA